MPPTQSRHFRLVALLVAGATMAGCAPVRGPYQAQADGAAYACQMGNAQACYDYQYIAPAANAEAAQAQQDANVGTAVAAGVLGAVAGAAIISSANSRSYRRDRGYYNRGYHRGYRRGYYR